MLCHAVLLCLSCCSPGVFTCWGFMKLSSVVCVGLIGHLLSGAPLLLAPVQISLCLPCIWLFGAVCLPHCHLVTCQSFMNLCWKCMSPWCVLLSSFCCHWCCGAFMYGSGSFSILQVCGAQVGKNIYLFSGTHCWTFACSAMKTGQFLSAAPCPLALGPVQFAQCKVVLSAAVHCTVWCCPPHCVQVSSVALQSGI